MSLSCARNVVRNVRHYAAGQSLAPRFGQEYALEDGMKEIDDQLKVIRPVISLTPSIANLAGIAGPARSWDSAEACFLENPSVEPAGDAVNIAAELPSMTTSNFHVNGSPDPKLAKQVLDWWSDIAMDDDIRSDTKIEIGEMANIVASSGAAVTNPFRVLRARERQEQRALHFGCLRYPDSPHPYFKLYRIEVYAYLDCTRTLWHQTDTRGIRTVITYRDFVPRARFITKVSHDDVLRQRALSEVDNLFV